MFFGIFVTKRSFSQASITIFKSVQFSVIKFIISIKWNIIKTSKAKSDSKYSI